MIIIGIALCMVGLIVLIFSWRGRVVARGEFCKKCRFDLAGLELDVSDSKCPECGSVVHVQTSRRRSLRRRSRVGLMLAVMLIVGGLSMLGVWASGNASVIMGKMPDSVVLTLTDMGMDAAIDELVLRVSRVPNPMSPAQIDKSIEMGLAHQADLMVGFDPRWGEVLYLTCVQKQMSQEQVSQYLLHGVNIDMIMRDRVHQGDEQLDCYMKITPGRLDALNGGPTDFMVKAKWVADGVVGEPSREYSQSGAMAAQVRVPSGGSWSTGVPYPINPSSPGFDGEIGSKVRVYTQYDFAIKDVGGQYGMANSVVMSDAENNDGYISLDRITVEHEVEIIDPSEPIVPTIDDSALAELAMNSLSIMPIRVMETLQEPQYQSGVPVLLISRQSLSLPESIALRAFLRIDDGREIEIGSWITYGPQPGHHGSGISWRINPEHKDRLIEAQEIVDRLIAVGKADVIFRTDATLAEGDPDIKQVINLTVLFEDVPVEVVEGLSNMYNSNADGWVKGRAFDEPETSDPDQSTPGPSIGQEP